MFAILFEKLSKDVCVADAMIDCMLTACLIKQVFADGGVDRRERIVEHERRRARVDGARECNALLLAAGQVDTLLANLGRVAGGQNGKVGSQRARADDACVALGVKRATVENIVADGRVLYICSDERMRQRTKSEKYRC